MSKQYDIFISYRRSGGSPTALHLYYLLNEDGYTVSFDVDTLREGKFAPELLNRIDNCTDFIIILNKEAFERTISGSCPKQNDWMRLELARAIQKKKNIIPVMLAGFEMPPKKILPTDIKTIVDFNGPHHSDEYFDGFYNRLKSFLHSKPKKKNVIAVESLNSIMIQHESLNTPGLITRAKKHIYLHAAYYPKYADDSIYDDSFRIALRNNPDISIKAIIIDPQTSWGLEFGLVLRNHFTTLKSFCDSMQGSINFFKQLKEEYPKNVEIIQSSALPFCPYIIIDDTLIIGHYAHARIKAPAGLWMEITNPIISEMCSRDLQKDKKFVDALNEENKAISRYIEDFQYALKNGRIL